MYNINCTFALLALLLIPSWKEEKPYKLTEDSTRSACKLTFEQKGTSSFCIYEGTPKSFVIFTRVNSNIAPYTGGGCLFHNLRYLVQVYDAHTDEWYTSYREWSGHVPCGWRFIHFEICRTCRKYLGEANIICHPRQ